MLLAAFNGSRWLQEQVESILAQMDVDVRLVISDDGSSDDTVAIIRAAALDRRVVAVSPPRPTGSAAQHFLWMIRATAAEGFDVVAFADQDDIWHVDKLSRAWTALCASGASGYSSATLAFWPDGRQALQLPSQRITESDFLFESAGQGCTYALTSSFYERLRAFFSQHVPQTASLHYHDWTVYALSRAWNLSWVFDAKPSLKYRQHSENDTGARTGVAGGRKRLGLIKSGWYSGQLRVLAELLEAARPDDGVITGWWQLLNRRQGPVRSLRIAAFCLRGGRRRPLDQVVLVGAALIGWI